MFGTPFENTAFELSILSKELNDDFGYYQSSRKVLRCPFCGTEVSSFLETGFVGCAECYSTFKDYARELALEIHRRPNHVGKVPKIEATRAMKKKELEILIKEKEIAVAKEEYRLADELKSKIEKLKGEI